MAEKDWIEEYLREKDGVHPKNATELMTFVRNRAGTLSFKQAGVLFEQFPERARAISFAPKLSIGPASTSASQSITWEEQAATETRKAEESACAEIAREGAEEAVAAQRKVADDNAVADKKHAEEAEAAVRKAAEEKAAAEKKAAFAKALAEKKAAEEKASVEAAKRDAEAKASVEKKAAFAKAAAEKKQAEKKAIAEVSKKAEEKTAAEKRVADEMVIAQQRAAEEKAAAEVAREAAEEKAEAEKNALVTKEEEKAAAEAGSKEAAERAALEKQAADKTATAEKSAEVEEEEKAAVESARPWEEEKSAAEEGFGKEQLESGRKQAEEQVVAITFKQKVQEKAVIEKHTAYENARAEKKGAEQMTLPEEARKDAEELAVAEKNVPEEKAVKAAINHAIGEKTVISETPNLIERETFSLVQASTPKIGDVDEAGEMPMGAVISIKQDPRIHDEDFEVEIITKIEEKVVVMPVEKPGDLYVMDIKEPVTLRRKTGLAEEILRNKADEAIAAARNAVEVSKESQTPSAMHVSRSEFERQSAIEVSMLQVGDVDKVGEMPMGAVISIKQDSITDDDEELFEVEIITKMEEKVIVMPVETPGDLYVMAVEEPVTLRRKTGLDDEALRRKADQAIAAAYAAAKNGGDAHDIDVEADTFMSKATEVEKGDAPTRQAVHATLQSGKLLATEDDEAKVEEEEKKPLPKVQRATRTLKSLLSREVIKRYDRNALSLYSEEHCRSFYSNDDIPPVPVQLASMSTKDLTEYMRMKKAASAAGT